MNSSSHFRCRHIVDRQSTKGERQHGIVQIDGVPRLRCLRSNQATARRRGKTVVAESFTRESAHHIGTHQRFPEPICDENAIHEVGAVWRRRKSVTPHRLLSLCLF
jgi:hypothetical protein